MNEFTIKNGVLMKYTGSTGKVTIPDEITSIGNDAFLGCKSLTEITFPERVKNIGENAFERWTRTKNGRK